jgi:O-antigen/teichoic acid export membrane protein
MVPAMQVLALWGLIRAIGTTTTQVFNALGKPDLSTKVKMSQVVIIICLIYPFTIRLGILGTSLTIVIATLIPNILACLVAVKILGGKLWQVSKMLLLPLVNTLIVLVVLHVARGVGNSGMQFCMQIVIGVLIYLGVTQIFSRLLKYDIWLLFKRVREELYP